MVVRVYLEHCSVTTELRPAAHRQKWNRFWILIPTFKHVAYEDHDTIAHTNIFV